MANQGITGWATVLTGTLLLAFTAETVGGEKVLLKRKYVDGRRVYIERKLDTHRAITGLPIGDVDQLATELTGVWSETSSLDDGGVRLELVFDRMARSLRDVDDGGLEYDTDDPENDEAAPQFKAILEPMIGMPVSMEIDKDGKVTAFTGLDAINEKVSQTATVSMHWQQMQRDFTDERGRKTWGEDPLLIYPDKEVEVGDVWEASASSDSPDLGAIAREHRFKAEKIGVTNGRKMLHISSSTKVSRVDSPEDGDGQKPIVEGTFTGKAVFDVELGMVVKRTSTGKLRVERPFPFGSTVMKAALEMTSSVSVLKEADRRRQQLEARKKTEQRRRELEEDDG